MDISDEDQQKATLSNTFKNEGRCVTAKRFKPNTKKAFSEGGISFICSFSTFQMLQILSKTFYHYQPEEKLAFWRLACFIGQVFFLSFCLGMSLGFGDLCEGASGPVRRKSGLVRHCQPTELQVLRYTPPNAANGGQFSERVNII